VISVTSAQVSDLPERLAGATIAVRLAPGERPPARVLADLEARGARTALHIVAVPDPDAALEDGGDPDLIVFEAGGGADLDRLAFDLKRVLTAWRARRPAARLLVAIPPAAREALRARGLVPYVDEFVDAPAVLTRAEDLFAPIPPEQKVIRTLPDGADVRSIATVAVSAAPWFPAGLVPVPGRPLTCAGAGRIAAYLNPQTLDLVGTSQSCPAAAKVTGDVAGVVAERLDAGILSAFRLPAGTGERFAEGVTVGGARTLTVEEIVARHQAASARQSAGVRTEIAEGTLTLTFDAPGFVAPVTIAARTRVFRDAGPIEMQQSDVRVNGVLFTAKDGVPRLPIIEPERVAVFPLTITLTSVYRYWLNGRETIDGRPCYVIAFAPRENGAARFRGRAWIDERTFAMTRVSAVQTGLTGPIVASEQTDTFVPDTAGRWLLARSAISQTYEGASLRTPIHRLLILDRHEVNAADFAARRAAAHASTDVILRDTPAGFRYLRREASPAPRSGGGEAQPEAGSDITRVVAPPVTRIRTAAVGVIVDPNITTPLPFAGLSYVDFDLFGSGTQFNGFFGGSYAQAAFSAPSIGGTRWQIAGRAFAIATSYNDRAFVEGREIYTRDIRQRPAQVSVWALRPIGARAAARFEYDWDYNRFDRNDVTDPAFRIPRNQNAHGLRLGLDLQYAGWQTSLWGSHTVRVGWRRWGVPGSEEDVEPRGSFQRFGVNVLRAAAISPRVTGRVEGAMVGGRNMDRFSRISFGTFDNRLHGYPSALIRYDQGGVLRTALSWAAARAVRIDGFADAAAVHDPGFGRGLRGYTGFGAALECPAPFGMLAAVEWGYGVQGIDTDGRRGTHVVRIAGYKVF
jgi:hypothetical protein